MEQGFAIGVGIDLANVERGPVFDSAHGFDCNPFVQPFVALVERDYLATLQAHAESRPAP